MGSIMVFFFSSGSSSASSHRGPRPVLSDYQRAIVVATSAAAPTQNPATNNSRFLSSTHRAATHTTIRELRECKRARGKFNQPRAKEVAVCVGRRPSVLWRPRRNSAHRRRFCCCLEFFFYFVAFFLGFLLFRFCSCSEAIK